MARSRYQFGEANILHKGKVVNTSVGTAMDDFIANIEKRYTFEIGAVPAAHDVRPDLTSYLFYDTVGYWWLPLQYNNINDPFEGFTAGTVIKIPNLS